MYCLCIYPYRMIFAEFHLYSLCMLPLQLCSLHTLYISFVFYPSFSCAGLSFEFPLKFSIVIRSRWNLLCIAFVFTHTDIFRWIAFVFPLYVTPNNYFRWIILYIPTISSRLDPDHPIPSGFVRPSQTS